MRLFQLAGVAALVHPEHPMDHTIVLHKGLGEDHNSLEVTAAGSLLARRARSIGSKHREHLTALAQRSSLVSTRQLSHLREHHKQLKGEKKHVLLEEDDETPHATLALRNLRDAEYVGPIGVGTPKTTGDSLVEADPQQVNVVFDTGSTNLWIASTYCTSHTCAQRSRFDPDTSRTFTPDADGTYLDVKFGTGELQGYMATDDLHVGPITVKQQNFAMIEKEIGDVFESIPFEGILGLAFPAMSAGGVTPLLDNVIDQKVMAHNEFSFFFTRLPETASAVFFGGVDKRFYEAPIRMFPVTEPFYWTLHLESLKLGDAKLNVGEDGKAINRVVADTGTTFFTAPKSVVHHLLRALPEGASCGDHGGLPDLVFTLRDDEGKMHDLSVPPHVYMVGDAGGSVCEPAFMPLDLPAEHGPAFLLGEVFMRHYYTVFDRRDGRSAYVGFARARHDKDAMLELEGGGVPHGSVNGHQHFSG